MLATQTMLQLGVPLNRVLATLRQVREERYAHMRGFFRGATDEAGDDDDQPRLKTLVLHEGAACVGRTLESLNLRGMGVELTAIRRRGERVKPEPTTRLLAGDVLVLMGAQDELGRAEMRLLQG